MFSIFPILIFSFGVIFPLNNICSHYCDAVLCAYLHVPLSPVGNDSEIFLD